MKQIIRKSFVYMVVLLSVFSFSTTAYASGYYLHDPMANPKAAADIIVNPQAVYGYSPNPDSARLGAFAQFDWSDEAFVAEMQQQREEYHATVRELYQIKADMEADGKSFEDIARAVSNRRNEIRMESYKDDPERLEKLKESNLAAFGNESGGTPEFFYEKYGSWETVIEKAFSTNAGADACLGLYDKYYDTYIISCPASGDISDSPGTTPESTSPPTTAEPVNYPASTADKSMTSPKTGDHSTGVTIVILSLAGMGAAVAAALIYSAEKDRNLR